MKPLVNSREMYQIDHASVGEGYSTNQELMENAGKAVVESIASRWQGLDGLVVGVACGKGKNGGDGLVVARLLSQNGATVRVLLTNSPEQMSSEAFEQLRLAEKTNIKFESWFETDCSSISFFTGVDILVDGLLGIGQEGAPRDPVSRVIELLNKVGKPIFSIDIPSGVVADNGSVPGSCVKASVTITFGFSKIGHLFHPGRDYCGALEVADIGFNPRAIDTVSADLFLSEIEDVRTHLPYRKGNAHKGNCGSVAVIAGSMGMTGAAALTSEAALRVGSGSAVLGIAKSLNDILEHAVTEVMTHPLPEVRRNRCLSLRSLGSIEKMLTRASVLALGPGLGRHHETAELVRRLIVRCPIPLVLDADGLNACVGHLSLFSQRTKPTILTPHIGEFSRLLRVDAETVVSDLVNLAKNFAEKHQIVLLLKGAPSIVALPNGKVLVNSTGNAGMATAGSGDVLTGAVAGLVAQGVGVEDASVLGAYLHGHAGDRARDRLGEWGLVAGDILAELPHAFVDCSVAN
ncbi:MAG: NAD(P)H-hydrate dehydratase [Candidatus Latescibacterota bacterium]|nr:NAD(P)H-hydrate dehydratase [Candidatus Latescibacterota bacterium]